MAEKSVEARIKDLLEEPFWLHTLKSNTAYFRTHDDCDGDTKKGIQVIFDKLGDAHFSVQNMKGECRFRTFGGGQSLRVRNALLILAEAIRLDNDDHPLE